MNKEDLIVDILEKIHEKVEESRNDIQGIKIQQALHDAVVKVHESRSTQLTTIINLLEARVEIVEKDAQFFRNFVKTVTILAAVATFIAKAFPWIQSHL